jgi:hypothetical protein
MPPEFDEIVGHRTQVRCAHCSQGWVTLDVQEDAPAVPHKKCEACLKQSHSQRAEQRAQDPKPRGRPRGRPPKQAQKKSNRGRKPKSDLRDRFGDSLHVTAQIDHDGDEPAASPPAPRRWGRPPKQRPNDGDELPAPPPVSPPAIRPRGRARGRAWGPPPPQRPNAGRRVTAEPSPIPPTRLPTRHTRRGSELAPPPKRSRRGTLFLDEEEDEQHEGEEEEEDDDGEESPTRRNDGRNRVTSRSRTRATNIDSIHETPRRRLRHRSVRNPPSVPRPRLTRRREHCVARVITTA